MKRLFVLLTFVFAALLLILITPSAMAQSDPTVQGPTVLSTSVPEGGSASDEGGLEFKLPALDDKGYAWMYGLIIGEFVIIVVLIVSLRGSVPLPMVNALLGIGNVVTRAIPGTADDRAYDWFQDMVKPSFEPRIWPSLITKLAEEGVISRMLADEVISGIAAQKLNPYQSYEQANAMAAYLRAKAAPAVPAVKEGAGAPSASAEGFRAPNREA